VLCGKGVMVNRTCYRLRQNKANFPARPHTGAGQGSHQRSCRSGVLRQTNPICGRRAGKTIAKAGGLDAATREGQTCETKPISEEVSSVKCQVLSAASRASSPRSLPTSDSTLGSQTQNSAFGGPFKLPAERRPPKANVRNEPNSRQGRAGRGTNAQNEPNSSIADWERTCCGMPALRPAASGLRGAVVQTNPIGRSQSCETNPIFPAASGGTSPQGVGRGTNAQNEPNFRCRRVERSRRGMARGANVRNKANWPPGSRSRRYPTIPLFYYSSIPIRCRWCETKPLW